jgi:hypothetical protein
MLKRVSDPLSSQGFRDAILEEHEVLRDLLAKAIALADGHERSASDLGDLRAQSRQLYVTLEEHMSFEERMLPVALRDVIGWSQALEARIAEDHGRQRRELAAALALLDEDGLSWDRLTDEMRAFSSTLLHDMETEEAGLLEADLDAVATDGEGG